MREAIRAWVDQAANQPSVWLALIVIGVGTFYLWTLQHPTKKD